MFEPTPKPKWKKRLKILGWLALASFLLLGTAFLFRAPILTAMAEAWIVHEPDFEWVDAVIVPGGGLETRPFQAAKLYHAGKTDTVVTFRTETNPSTELGITPEHHEQNVKVLEGLEVNPIDIVVIGSGVASTWDEVQACRQWSEEAGHESLAIMTELFPSRRVHWTYEEAFQDTDKDLFVWAITPKLYAANSWWRNERGVVAFQNEVIKYAYYLLNY